MAMVTPLPVLYACHGCAEYGQLARDVGAFFEQAGALDGCKKACALRWLAERGVVPESAYVLPGILG